MILFSYCTQITNKNVENAIAVVWKMRLVAESRFRKLNAPELMAKVYLGVEFKDGVRVKPQEPLHTQGEEWAAA